MIGGVCFAAAIAFRGDHQIALILVISSVCPIGLLIVVGLLLAVSRTDKLQAAEYQIRQRTLELIQEKGGRIRVGPASLQSIVTPTIDSPGSAGDPTTELPHIGDS